MKLCPDCKHPVFWQPDMKMKIGGPDRSYWGCSNPRCGEKFDSTFEGFIEVNEALPIAKPETVRCPECGVQRWDIDPKRTDRIDWTDWAEDCPHCWARRKLEEEYYDISRNEGYDDLWGDA